MAYHDAVLGAVRQAAAIDRLVWGQPETFSDWIGWHRPGYLLDFMSTLNLEFPYGDMHEREIRMMEGENKFVRLLIRYTRRYLEAKGRVRVSVQTNRLCYVSRSHYWIELPRWVQDIHTLEHVSPSPDFFALRARLERYTDEWLRLHDLA